MMLSIDRIEGSFAICIDERQGRHSIPLASLPKGTGEGDILRQTESGYQLEPQGTGRRRKAVSERLSRLGAASRRSAVSQLLEQTTEPVSASALADKFRVSRQIIVGDIALLRASGAPVVATPRGYLMERAAEDSTAQDYTVACRHENVEQLLQELYIVVDQGATVRDVIVEHPIYGQLTGQLQISSRFEADRFIKALTTSEASPLSQLTAGIHLHTLRCPDRACYERVAAALKSAGILVSE
ncbi:3H domain protein [anaerobic digester metagenome]